MCLISNTKTPHISKKDITCYKVYKMRYFSAFTLNNKPFVELISPFVYSSVKSFPCTLDESKIATAIFELPKKDNCYSIGKGVFHTDSLLQSSFCTITCIQSYAVIVKCTIPKNTEYFQTPDGYELASKKLILKKILSPHECRTILKKEGIDYKEINFWIEKYKKSYIERYVKLFLNNNTKCV